MHDCLRISEITRLICAKLYIAESKGSIAKLARTCRAFQDPALDVLWYEIRDFSPLIKCMPSDLWTVRDGCIVLLRAIEESDWSRFDAYAQRVRTFLTLAGDITVDSKDLQILALARGYQVLLPRVQHVWWSTNDEVFPFIHLVLGPLSRKLTLTCNALSMTQPTFLSTLKHRYPGLTYIDVMLPNGSIPSYVRAAEVAMCGWNQLCSLVICNPSRKALDSIAILPKLERLTLLWCEGFSTDFRHWKTLEFFPSLKALRVRMITVAACTALLAAILPIHTLTSIAVVTSESWKDSYWPDLLSVLSYQHHSSITSIEASNLALPSRKDEDNLVTVDHLRPILTFSNITHLGLLLGRGILLDDKSVVEVAKALPRIVSLTFYNPVNLMGKGSHLTLYGLLAFAQYSPHLQYLSVHIDAREVQELSPDKVVFSKMLTTLHVSFSPINDSQSVAVFLSRIFPALQTIGVGPRSKFQDKWEGVRQLLSLCHAIRREERMLTGRMHGVDGMV